MKKFLSLLTIFILTVFFMAPINSEARSLKSIFKAQKMGKYAKDMNGIIKFFDENSKEFNVKDAKNNFKEKTIKNDEQGNTHIKLQQVVDGIPVYGNEYIVHFDANSEIYAVNGEYDVKANEFKRNGNFMTPQKAVKIAKEEVVFDADSLNADLVDNLQAQLYLYNVEDSYIPVYLVRVNFLSPEPGDWYLFINAYTGEIVNKYNKLQTVASTATGAGVLGDIKTLNVDMVSVRIKGKTVNQYQLVDKTRPTTIYTYTCNNGTTLPGSVVYSTTTTINDKAAVDAHYYAGVVYDYYKTKFNRNSIDNMGMAIKSSVHYKRSYVNAFWNGTQMVYGDGDGTNATYLSGSLDIIAHEMTHGVDEKEADLIYANQSGALNEALSDIFGAFIEYYGQASKFDWLIGEDVWTPSKSGDALRSMSNPSAYGDPEHMSQFKVLPNTQAGDWGGVHTNSGIMNKAAYNVVMNLSTDLSVSIPKAEKIYYKALCDYMTASTDFAGAKNALAQAASDLYGANSAEYNAVINGFSAVGVN